MGEELNDENTERMSACRVALEATHRMSGWKIAFPVANSEPHLMGRELRVQSSANVRSVHHSL